MPDEDYTETVKVIRSDGSAMIVEVTPSQAQTIMLQLGAFLNQRHGYVPLSQRG